MQTFDRTFKTSHDRKYSIQQEIDSNKKDLEDIKESIMKYKENINECLEEKIILDDK